MAALRGVFLLVFACAVLFFHDLDATDLWTSHEARAAQNAQRMLDDQSFALPHLYDGQIDMQKPPAFYWLVAATAAARAENVDRWAVRLPAAIAATLTVLMVWLFLARQGRPLAGLIAGMVLATSIHFAGLARTGRIDMPLTCATTACLLVMARSPRSSPLAGFAGRGQGEGSTFVRVAIAGLLVAFAILLKGPIGLVLPFGVMICWIMFERWQTGKCDRPRVVTLIGAGMIGIVLASPWFMWANHTTHGEFYRIFFWHHHVERALGNSSSLAIHPWWYYLPRFAFDFLPWTPFLLVAISSWSRRLACTGSDCAGEPPAPQTRDSTADFGLIWFVAVIGLLSCARFKRGDYLLPAYPGAAIFLGCMMERWYQSLGPRTTRLAQIAFLLVVSGTLTGWQWFHAHVEPKQQAVREQHAFAEHIRRQCPIPRTVLLFRVESHLLAYHLGRPVHTLVEWSDLNNLLRERGEHWFVTRAEFVAECQEFVVTRRLQVTARSEEFSQSSPQRPLVLIRTIDEATSCPSRPPKD